MDLAELLETATPRTDEVTVCARGDLVARHAELVAQLGEASSGTKSLGGDSTASGLAEQIVAVEEEMEASSATFHLQSIGHRAWADLLGKHPPRKEDTGKDHNPLTFPPAAVAACTVSPPITEDDAVKLSEALTTGEWNKLWISVFSLNVVGMPRPKLAAATELLRANGRSSGTPAGLASPEASSSDGSGDPSPSTTTTTADD